MSENMTVIMNQRLKQLRRRRRIIMIICVLLIALIVGVSVAFLLRDTEDVPSYKYVLSANESKGATLNLNKLEPNMVIIDDEVSFTKNINSVPVYIRSKISFSSTDSSNPYLTILRAMTNFNQITTAQNGAVWGSKSDNYIYLMEENSDSLMKISDTTKYIFANSLKLVESFNMIDGVDYTNNIKIHITVEAISATIIDPTDYDGIVNEFDEVYPLPTEEEIPNYIVTFTDIFGTIIDAQIVVESKKITEPADPSKDNYSFGGWYTSTAFDTPFNFDTLITSATTIYAKWNIDTHTVNFTDIDGTNLGSQTIDYGSKASEPTDPSKDNHSFGGWYTSTTFTTEFDFDTPILSATTIYAKWNIDTYLVSFTDVDSANLGNQTIDHGSKASEPTDPSKDNHSFGGWYTSTEFTTEFDFDTLITSTTTIYAKWNIDTYLVSFTDVDSANLGSQTIDHGSKASEPTDPSKDNHSFGGWYTSTTFTTEFGFDTLITSATTIYAKWNIDTHTVNFTDIDGTNLGSQTIDYGSKASESVEPSKDNHSFGGWYTSTAFTTPFDFDTLITSATTIYAKWNIDTHPVNFTDIDGANLGSQTIDHGSKASEPVEPSKDNHSFGGWYTSTDFGALFDFDTAITSATTIYAKWVADNPISQVESILTIGGFTSTTMRLTKSDSSTLTIKLYDSTNTLIDTRTSSVSGAVSFTYIDLYPSEEYTIKISITEGDGTYNFGQNSSSTKAFSNDILKAIHIGSQVKTISSYAFYSCTGLTEIIIPASVETIGTSAFGYCTGLSSVILGDNVETIGNLAFAGCKGLTEIIIPDSVKYINSFNSCTGITSVILGNSVETIGESAFNGCTGLTEIIIPDSVKFLSGFYACTGLTEIIIPDSVETIGEYAFKGCTGLTEIIIPDSVVTIGFSDGSYSVDFGSFYGCTGLISVILGNNVETIGRYAFKGCTGLTEIIIPDSVVTIGSSAFYGCIGLTEIIIPDSVVSIREYVFSGCTGLSEIIIPDSVVTIGDSAFQDCIGLTEIIIPDSVETIGMYAFSSCKGLTKIIIPDSVVSIGYYAFQFCTELTEIVIPDSVVTISSYTFYNCSKLTEIIIPDSVVTIESYAFAACIKLTEIIIPDSVKTIGMYAFSSCKGLTKIIIPDSVKTISDYTFQFCTELTEIIIPDSVVTIGKYAFYGCTGLTKIIIPDSVETIGSHAFNNCRYLTSIIIGNGVKTITNSAFYACNGLSIVYYTGTEIEWDDIEIGTDYNSSFINATRYYYSETYLEGAWHYVEGVPTMW